MPPAPATVPHGQEGLKGENDSENTSHWPKASGILLITRKHNTEINFFLRSGLKDSFLFVISLSDSKPQSKKDMNPNSLNRTLSWAPMPFPETSPEEREVDGTGAERALD